MTLANPSDPLKHQNVLLLAIIIGCVSEQIAGRRRAQLAKEEHIAFLCGEHVHFNCWGTMLLHTTHGLGLWHSGTVCPCTCNMACLFFYYYFLARLYNEQFNSSLSCFWVALTFFFFSFPQDLFIIWGPHFSDASTLPVWGGNCSWYFCCTELLPGASSCLLYLPLQLMHATVWLKPTLCAQGTHLW